MTKKVTFPRVFALALVLFTLLAMLPNDASAASAGSEIPPSEVIAAADKEAPVDPVNGPNQSAGNDQPGSEGWNLPDYSDGLETKVQPYGSSFLYWAMMSLDPNPEIVYDTGLDAVFLSYRIDSAGKLTGLMMTYDEAFRLQRYLDSLIEANDIDKAIWQKPDWREKSIGEQLSDATVAKLKAGNYDAYEAIEIIKASDEYINSPDTIPNLREQVDYHLASMSSTKYHVIRGLQQLKLAYIGLTDSDISTAEPTVAGVIATAQKRLEEHPELECLAEVHGLRLTGKTSNALATFQAIVPEKCDELWANVAKVAEARWPDEYKLLETTRFAVPFPAASYVGPVEEVPPTPVPVPNELPTSATGN